VNSFLELENQMLDFEPQNLKKGNSPDRMDALVHAITELMIKPQSKIQSYQVNPWASWI